jgi:hypothetical protein
MKKTVLNYLTYCCAWFALVFMLIFAATSCKKETIDEHPNIDRHDVLPLDISKRTPETDNHPPILHCDEYYEPVPLGSSINTSGAEDSPFILPDGETLYFFFTPDVRVAPESQLLDDVTGVWVSYKSDGVWSEAERVWLQEPGKLALDGAVSIFGNEMWFASAREGYTGVNMFTAEFSNNEWHNIEYAGDRLNNEIQIGEVHLHNDELYFHSTRTDGQGGQDIWLTNRESGSWINPINIAKVNTSENEGFPFISSNGNEMWFSRTYLGTPAIYRSIKNGNEWGEPELIISQFAGEPTLDDTGNIYFVHHYFENDIMIEADIYVAYRKLQQANRIE